MTTHYQIVLNEVCSSGYVVVDHLIDDEALVIIGEADAAEEGASKALSSLFEGDLIPGDDDDEAGADGE